jgi:hypothetical protein
MLPPPTSDEAYGDNHAPDRDELPPGAEPVSKLGLKLSLGQVT